MRETIQQLAHDISGIAINDIRVNLRDRLEHQTNDLYDVCFDDTHWIAKVYTKADEFLDAPRREYHALKWLETFDIAPKALHYAPYPQYSNPIVLYQFMTGEMWNRTAPSDAQWEALAQVWLKPYAIQVHEDWVSRTWQRTIPERLHFHQSLYQMYFRWAETHFPQGIPHVKRIFERYNIHHNIFQQLIEAQPKLVFTRCDPRFANIIQRPDGRIGIIDWEDSGRSDPAIALSELTIHPNNEDLVTQSGWGRFLEVYYTNYPVDDPSLAQRAACYCLLHSLMWFGGLLVVGIRRAEKNDLAGWRINEMEANERLKRYYARCLTYPATDFERLLPEIQDVRFFPA